MEVHWKSKNIILINMSFLVSEKQLFLNINKDHIVSPTENYAGMEMKLTQVKAFWKDKENSHGKKSHIFWDLC